MTYTPWEMFPPDNPTQIKTEFGHPGMDESQLLPVVKLGEGVNKMANAQQIVNDHNTAPLMLEALDKLRHMSWWIDLQVPKEHKKAWMAICQKADTAIQEATK